MNNKKIVVTSWYFNPLHPGHIECFDLCKELGDELRVIVNNDQQAKAKTWSDSIFQDEEYRIKVVSSLKSVDRVMLAIDSVDLVADPLIGICDSIRHIHDIIKQTYWPNTEIIFWKGGDRFANNIPEFQLCNELWITIKDWLWAKIDNSSFYRAKRI